MKELIQDAKWWENHNNGIGFYATHKAIKDNKYRYFIGDIDEIQNYLGSKWKVYPV